MQQTHDDEPALSTSFALWPKVSIAESHTGLPAAKQRPHALRHSKRRLSLPRAGCGTLPPKRVPLSSSQAHGRNGLGGAYVGRGELRVPCSERLRDGLQ